MTTSFNKYQGAKRFFCLFLLVGFLGASLVSAAGFTVEVQGNYLTVRAEEASLPAVFREIGKQGGFEVEIKLDADLMVSADFERLELAAGIKRLHENTLIVYTDDKITRLTVGAGQSDRINKLADLLTRVFPQLKSAAKILDGLRNSSHYHLISSALTDILTAPGSWKERLQELSQDVTPQIREDLFAEIRDELSGYAQGQGILSGVSPNNYSSAHILVKFAPEATTEDINALDNLTGAEISRQFPHISNRLYKLSVPSYLDIPSMLAIYRDYPLVLYAEPDYTVHALATPNDPSFSLQYAHTVSGAEAAWDQTTGDPAVVIAVVDTGVDYTHNDLSANMWTNPGEIAGNSLDDDGNGYVDDVYGINAITGSGNPMDDHGHGTHVAGIIGAVGNNALGVAGVNWQSSIMALKFLPASGSGSTSDAITCLDYAIAQGAHLTNNSWGGGGFSQSLLDAISKMNSYKITFVAAAGNDTLNNDSTPFYPSGYDLDNVISVAATDSSDILAGFSNYGATTVDVAAPGKDIYSASIGNTFVNMSGTSMAAPYVAGIIGLLAAKNPSVKLNPAGIRQALIDSCDKIANLNGKVVSGGRVNVLSALNSSFVGQDYSVAVEVAKDMEKKEHSDCFIATASFGSPLAGPVRVLCRFRDKYLLTSRVGRKLVKFYYETSPPLAAYISHKPVVRFFVRLVLWLPVILSWLILSVGFWPGLLILAAGAGAGRFIIRKFLSGSGLAGLFILFWILALSRPAVAQEIKPEKLSGSAAEITEEWEETDTVAGFDEEDMEDLTDISGRFGIRFKGGVALNRDSSADFFDSDDVEFSLDTAFAGESELVYGLSVNDYYKLALGASLGHIKRGVKVSLKSGFPSDDFGEISSFPLMINAENRFSLRENVVIFFKLGFGYSFNSFDKGNYFDELEQIVAPNRSFTYSAEAEDSYVYRVGTGFEYFISNRISASLTADYLGMKPKIKVTEKEGVTGKTTESSPGISLNSLVFSFGVNFYY
ncbi:MAG: S8 family peptidase [bacterium]